LVELFDYVGEHKQLSVGIRKISMLDFIVVGGWHSLDCLGCARKEKDVNGESL
jgi:hypothetical protein